MKIGIDIRKALEPYSGKARYTYEVVRQLLEHDKHNEYILYTYALSSTLANFKNARFKVIRKKSLFWHYAVAKDWQLEAQRHSGDVFFAPTSFIIPSILYPQSRSVVTVHDLIAFLYPRLHELKATLTEKFFLGRALNKASAVVVPSENTKKDLLKLYTYDPARVHVTPLGIDPTTIVHRPLLPKKNYVLAVSGMEPRKNLARLIQAFELVAEQYPHIELRIIGAANWKSGEALRALEKAMRKFGERITHIPHATAKELETHYKQAQLLVFPSLYEGFGLPPLEAMASGCPVVCSQVSSLPEVCNDAAVYVDPLNIESIADGMEKVLASPQLQKELIQKGLVRAKTMTWRQTAEKTLRVLDGRSMV